MNTNKNPTAAKAMETYFDSAIAHDRRWSKTQSWGITYCMGINGNDRIEQPAIASISLGRTPRDTFVPQSDLVRMFTDLGWQTMRSRRLDAVEVFRPRRYQRVTIPEEINLFRAKQIIERAELPPSTFTKLTGFRENFEDDFREINRDENMALLKASEELRDNATTLEEDLRGDRLATPEEVNSRQRTTAESHCQHIAYPEVGAQTTRCFDCQAVLRYADCVSCGERGEYEGTGNGARFHKPVCPRAPQRPFA